jgi:cardiolipin synthase
MTWSWWFIYGVVEWLIRLAMVPVVLRRRFVPATSLAWLSLVFFLPLVGLVVYLLVGSNRMSRRRVRRHRDVIVSTRSGPRPTRRSSR